MLPTALVLVAIPLIAVAGFQWHVRSDGYRRNLETRISASLGAPLSIGSVEPLSLRSRRLHNVQVRSNRRNADVFECALADWRQFAGDGARSRTLDLRDGWLVVGSTQWEREDYDELLRTGLGHDFAEWKLAEVHLDNVDLQWLHPSVNVSAQRASGTVRFDEDGVGRAVIEADRLNKTDVPSPIRIDARFTPGERIRFHEILLTIPEASLPSLQLDALLGGTVTQGGFVGSVSYRHRNGEPVLQLSGAVRNALLAELTRNAPGGPFSGNVDIVIDDAIFRVGPAGTLETLRFNGAISELTLGQIVPVLDPTRSGRLNVHVQNASYEGGMIHGFSAVGSASRLSLDSLTQLIGRGRITGTLNVDIHSILIVDDELVLADATFDAVPPDAGTGSIERAVLKTMSERLLGFDATVILPPQMTEIEYSRLGVRLVLNRNELRVHGTHGDNGETILTVSVWGREFGVVKAPDEVFQVEDVIAWAREHIDEKTVRRLASWLGISPPFNAADPE